MATIPPSDRRTTHTGIFGVPATLRSLAKLSNEAVKCRKCDASRQNNHNM
jgi:hypothetical protein